MKEIKGGFTDSSNK